MIYYYGTKTQCLWKLNALRGVYGYVSKSTEALRRNDQQTPVSSMHFNLPASCGAHRAGGGFLGQEGLEAVVQRRMHQDPAGLAVDQEVGKESGGKFPDAWCFRSKHGRRGGGKSPGNALCHPVA